MSSLQLDLDAARNARAPHPASSSISQQDPEIGASGVLSRRRFLQLAAGNCCCRTFTTQIGRAHV